jgi:hypothetical protein
MLNYSMRHLGKQMQIFTQILSEQSIGTHIINQSHSINQLYSILLEDSLRNIMYMIKWMLTQIETGNLEQLILKSMHQFKVLNI